MPIYTVEVAIECDDIEAEGLLVLTLMAEAIGLKLGNADGDDAVELGVGSSEDGRPVLMAVMSASESGERAVGVEREVKDASES